MQFRKLYLSEKMGGSKLPPVLSGLLNRECILMALSKQVRRHYEKKVK